MIHYSLCHAYNLPSSNSIAQADINDSTAICLLPLVASSGLYPADALHQTAAIVHNVPHSGTVSDKLHSDLYTTIGINTDCDDNFRHNILWVPYYDLLKSVVNTWKTLLSLL